MAALDKLEPSLIWRHFANICSIPHPSKHESKLVAYVQSFASRYGLNSKIDSIGNIVVSKPATKGMENRPAIILQSHLDMVPQKNDSTQHDFTTDPIRPFIDGQWVKAKDTTLGADNGIGTATILAILEAGDIKHGPIEAFFTIDEETGMTGALGLSKDLLTGSKLINFDTEEEGQLYIGCAGGVDCSAEIIYEEEHSREICAAFSISLKGLKGGHSGIDIHSGRGNAIKLLNRILFTGSNLYSLRISSFNGGSVRNAIPREAFAIVTVPMMHSETFRAFIKEQEKLLRAELYGSEPALTIEISEAAVPENVLSLKSQNNILGAVYACPNGVIRMSSRVQGVVETSNNLALINCQKGKAYIHCLLRSSIETAIKDLENAVSCALTQADAHVEFSGGYPGWEPDPDSRLLKTMIDVYESVTGKLPDVKVVHAGLECGIIGSKYPGMEMVSCGPTIQYPHSPDERVEIASVERFWKYILKLLEVV